MIAGSVTQPFERTAPQLHHPSGGKAHSRIQQRRRTCGNGDHGPAVRPRIEKTLRHGKIGARQEKQRPDCAQRDGREQGGGASREAERQHTPAFADVARLTVNAKENFATRTAALIVPTVGDNRLRHDMLQRFMLANDSVTVAVEVPIWLDADAIASLEAQYGIELLPKDAAVKTITGHIDFLQVRNGAVHILDYKPDARTNKPIAQLAIYALALTKLAGLSLFDIKCAWFNEAQYCEFFPRTLFPKRVR